MRALVHFLYMGTITFLKKWKLWKKRPSYIVIKSIYVIILYYLYTNQ